MTESSRSSAGRTARRTLVVVAIVAIALLLWQIVDALLLIFIGILIAVLLRGAATRLSRHTPLGVGWSLAAVSLALVGLLLAGGFLLGPRVSEQYSELARTLPESIDQLRQSLEQSPFGEFLLSQADSSGGAVRGGGQVFSRLTGAASRALGMFTDILLILFAAIFFAINPRPYKDGLLLLIPKTRVERVGEALNASGDALWKFLMGKLIAMLFVGVFVTLGLMLIGVPMALALGVLAGFLDFVPFIGPIVAAVPGVLLALTVGPVQALYAALVYFLAQQIEGNLLSPLVQKAEVSLPPVMVLFAVLAAGLLFGILGMIVATPLFVVGMVLVKMLYVEDALGKSVEIPGQ